MNKKISLIFLLLTTLACALPSAPPLELPPQAIDENSLQTFIVQTADAAQTQTALFIPTSTFTPTATRTPSPTPTPTATFKFLFPTFTLVPTSTPIGLIPQAGAGSEAGATEESIYTDHPWSCRVIGTQPPVGAIIKRETTFYAYWTVINTGNNTWLSNGVDMIHTGGLRQEGTRIQDLANNVPKGGKIVLGAEFIAPKREGEYGSHFVLKVGNKIFCGMEISFQVIK